MGELGVVLDRFCRLLVALHPGEAVAASGTSVSTDSRSPRPARRTATATTGRRSWRRLSSRGGLDLDLHCRHVGEGLRHRRPAQPFCDLTELGRLGVLAAEDGEQVGGKRVIQDGDRHDAQVIAGFRG